MEVSLQKHNVHIIDFEGQHDVRERVERELRASNEELTRGGGFQYNEGN